MITNKTRMNNANKIMNKFNKKIKIVKKNQKLCNNILNNSHNQKNKIKLKNLYYTINNIMMIMMIINNQMCILQYAILTKKLS